MLAIGIQKMSLTFINTERNHIRRFEQYRKDVKAETQIGVWYSS